MGTRPKTALKVLLLLFFFSFPSQIWGFEFFCTMRHQIRALRPQGELWGNSWLCQKREQLTHTPWGQIRILPSIRSSFCQRHTFWESALSRVFAFSSKNLGRTVFNLIGLLSEAGMSCLGNIFLGQVCGPWQPHRVLSRGSS